MESPEPTGKAAHVDVVRRALELSRYARRLVSAEPHLLADNNASLPFTADAMRGFLETQAIGDDAALKRALRGLRKQVMLRVIVRDLGGLATLAEVIATTTALAEVAIGCALRHLSRWLAAQYGTPRGASDGKPQELHVVGMGKLGGGELNVSSDVDLVFVYPEDGETDGSRRISNHEFFTRLARQLIAALSELTADGYVFRVDMRLRPYGDSGPLAVSYEMLETYFITQGREWERYAWIKGRVVCRTDPDPLTALVQPFVYRRHLDFGAVASLRDLHRQIRREVERREMHDNVKLGPGGIREIEFIAQVFQLIRGGRDRALQCQPTLAVLPLLAERNLLPRAAVVELTEAYVFLRNLEHRLQYLDDQQTQDLPTSREDRALLAAAMGYATYDALLDALEAHRSGVTRHFVQVFAGPRREPEEHPLAALWLAAEGNGAARLAEIGYANSERILERLAQLRAGSRYEQLPEASRARFDALVPQVIEIAAKFANPDATLERFLQLLEAISRRAAYLALLNEYPHAIENIAALANASSWAAEYLTRHPILLDELIDTRVLYAAPDWPQLKTALELQLRDAAGDTEREMDILRHFRHAQTFRLVAQDIAGLVPIETLADHLSDLADLVLGETIRLCWEGLRNRHRVEPAFAVIGYGKLGGKELGYASDLDIIFLYDDGAPEAQETYARLAQRINRWLTSLTPAGVLYETDLRLRPDGSGGMLVSPIEAFEDYQRGHAWVWEHQALTRGRFCAGDPRVGEKFERIRVAVLREQRDLDGLRREIIAMRKKMFDAHPNRSALFDIKHDRGGIVDVEFIVQFLVLGYSRAHPELTRNAGNLALLKLSGELGLIPRDLAQQVHAAYREFRQRQHRLRLNGEKYARVEPHKVRHHVAAVLKLWQTVLGEEDVKGEG